MSDRGRDILALTPVVPVLTIHHLEHAVPLAKALIKGGIKVLEVTLRSPQGITAIERIKNEVEGATVGAGTVINPEALDRALAAGSEFIITPGITPSLLQASDCDVPFIPGVATVSELMQCVDYGLKTLKFFPAEASGGVEVLKAFNAPFPDIKFCPTGGIGPHNIYNYLSAPNVISIGGSWIATKALIEAENWAGITELAKEACQLVASYTAHSNVEGKS